MRGRTRRIRSLFRTEGEVRARGDAIETANQTRAQPAHVHQARDEGKVGEQTAAGGAGSEPNLLLLVQWMRVGEGATLVVADAGSRDATAISVRHLPSRHGQRSPGRVLTEIPCPHARARPASGWFQSGGFLEIHSDRKQVAKLLNLLEKGNDFDRGTIVVV